MEPSIIIYVLFCEVETFYIIPFKMIFSSLNFRLLFFFVNFVYFDLLGYAPPLALQCLALSNFLKQAILAIGTVPVYSAQTPYRAYNHSTLMFERKLRLAFQLVRKSRLLFSFEWKAAQVFQFNFLYQISLLIIIFYR